MSSTSSAALADSVSGSSAPEDSARLPSAKSTRTAAPFSPSTGLASQSTRMCEPSAGSSATLFAADSPAKTSALPEMGLESTESDRDSGVNMRDSFASYDRAGSLWRTWQLCLEGGLAEYSETWPRSGMTRSGIAYLRPQLARCITGTDFGLRLIPTPTACDHKGSGRLRLERGENNNLRDWFKIKFGFLYPPVRAAEYLMGFPVEWASLKPTEMPSSRKSRKSSAAQSSQPNELEQAA